MNIKRTLSLKQVKNKSIFILVLSTILFMILMQTQQNLSQASNDKKKIPDNAIRLRILANSNSAADQQVKRDIRDQVNANVKSWVYDLTSASQAKQEIKSHLDDVRSTVREQLKAQGLDQDFTVQLGPAKFPTKMYGGYVYPAGTYQALVITLGSGEGANWWCVLFPPLCFLDFEHGDAVKAKDSQPAQSNSHQSDAGSSKGGAEQAEKPEVKFFIVDIFTAIIHFFKNLF
ncbi:stage II sporulation protein R [Tuberibacillus sp. Marseille-P3662]|uniref:stage II sporulation protein R n=1 Tax=Tuberibacillus sp. Marseille-P3662 TaxID=1965358 RepID=UPI00111C91B1|nr:stage II sporulation protein R [Tuberibacillus sp. Marseille-P3662]